MMKVNQSQAQSEDPAVAYMARRVAMLERVLSDTKDVMARVSKTGWSSVTKSEYMALKNMDLLDRTLVPKGTQLKDGRTW